MATDTLQDMLLNTSWQELTAVVPASAGISMMIQNVGTGNVQIVQGGSAAPTDRTGLRLTPGQDAYVNNARLWVRSYSATGGLISLNPL